MTCTDLHDLALLVFVQHQCFLIQQPILKDLHGFRSQVANDKVKLVISSFHSGKAWSLRELISSFH